MNNWDLKRLCVRGRTEGRVKKSRRSENSLQPSGGCLLRLASRASYGEGKRPSCSGVTAACFWLCDRMRLRACHALQTDARKWRDELLLMIAILLFPATPHLRILRRAETSSRSSRIKRKLSMLPALFVGLNHGHALYFRQIFFMRILYTPDILG